jgi:lactam utilization protein B
LEPTPDSRSRWFGRREINADPQDIFDFVLYQIGALSALAKAKAPAFVT